MTLPASDPTARPTSIATASLTVMEDAFLRFRFALRHGLEHELREELLELADAVHNQPAWLRHLLEGRGLAVPEDVFWQDIERAARIVHQPYPSPASLQEKVPRQPETLLSWCLGGTGTVLLGLAAWFFTDVMKTPDLSPLVRITLCVSSLYLFLASAVMILTACRHGSLCAASRATPESCE